MAAEDFKNLRCSIIEGDYQTDELSLGIPWAVVQQLCRFREGQLGRRVERVKASTTVIGQGVVAEYHPQKPPHHMHGRISRIYAFLAILNGFLEEKKKHYY